MENVLQQNFVSIWHHFLSFEIGRSKLAVKTWGSGNAYLVFQVIAWHHILVMNDEAKSELRDEAVKLWFKLTKTGLVCDDKSIKSSPPLSMIEVLKFKSS